MTFSTRNLLILNQFFIESQPDLTFLEPEGYSSRKGYLLQDSGGQFHKTFTSVIYKCSFWSVAIAFGT